MFDRNDRRPSSRQNRSSLAFETACTKVVATFLVVLFVCIKQLNFQFYAVDAFVQPTTRPSVPFSYMHGNVRKQFSHTSCVDAYRTSPLNALSGGGGGDDNDGGDDGRNGRTGGDGGGRGGWNNGDSDSDNEEDGNVNSEYFGPLERRRDNSDANALRMFGGGLLSLVIQQGKMQVPPSALFQSSSATAAGTVSESASRRSLTAMIAGHAYLGEMARRATTKVGSKAARSTSWYMSKLQTHPLLTKCATGGLIGFVGDYGAQWFSRCLQNRDSQNDAPRGDRIEAAHSDTLSMSYDIRRGLSVLANGIFVAGPVMHFGYGLFEHVLPVSKMPKGFRTLASTAHVLADAVILDSLFVATSLVCTGLLEGYRLRDEILPQFQREYGGTLKASWSTSAMILPYTLCCFRFLPVTLRPMAINVSDILWDGVVSYRNHASREAGDMPHAGM